MSSVADQLEPGVLLARGGEASVHRVAGRDDVVLKIYHADQQPDGNSIRRIQRLIESGTPVLRACCAWPDKLSLVGGRLALLMRRVQQAHELHMLIDRSTRLKSFSQADWKFMVLAAQHLAEACARVHAAGILLVDISEKNALVDRDGKVTLIDCDGFVFQGGGPFGCSTTFTLQWTAPELNGKPLAVTPRTANHDNFAIARAIFKLLFQGSEPMQSVHGDSDRPGERAFVFSRKLPVRQPAPFELTLDALPAEVAELFEQAFDPSSSTRGSRPGASTWAAALQAMAGTMRRCSRVRTHVYVTGPGRACPWCAIAARDPTADDFRDEVSARPTGTASPPQGGAVSRPTWRLSRRVRRGIVTAGVAAVALAGAARFLSETGEVDDREAALRRRAQAFVEQQFAIINDPNAAGDALVARYAAGADVYHGERNAQPQVWFKRMVTVWPFRKYQIVPGTLRLQCDTAQRSCNGTLIAYYQVRNSVRCNEGRWRYEYTLDLSHAAPLITSENGGKNSATPCANH